MACVAGNLAWRAAYYNRRELAVKELNTRQPGLGDYLKQINYRWKAQGAALAKSHQLQEGLGD